jgi:hypothetical protein
MQNLKKAVKESDVTVLHGIINLFLAVIEKPFLMYSGSYTL